MMENIMGSGKDETMCTITMRFMLKSSDETKPRSVSLERNRLLCASRIVTGRPSLVFVVPYVYAIVLSSLSTLLLPTARIRHDHLLGCRRGRIHTPIFSSPLFLLFLVDEIPPSNPDPPGRDSAPDKFPFGLIPDRAR
jgi:hypothetical protein